MYINRGELIVQQPYITTDGDHRWYVQEVALLDYGRFDTEYEAQQHKAFLDEKRSD